MSYNNVFGGMTLKALLENPDLQRAPATLSGAPHSKSKKTENGGTGDIDFTSAFLGPTLWDKTYDVDFNLEYMDLDEFLSENGIANVDSPNSAPVSPPLPATQSPVSLMAGSTHSPSRLVTPPPPPMANLSNPALSPNPLVAPLVNSAHGEAVSVVAQPSCISNFLVEPVKKETSDEADGVARTQSPVVASAGSTPPPSPLPVHVDFTLTEQDIALASVPGQNMFDPTACNFTEDELKPQPMIKKSKKVFVPEDLKDDKYWQRRKKNNYAAKRSRDARRIKENQIAMRAAYLEKESATLREEMEKMRRENAHLKHRLSNFNEDVKAYVGGMVIESSSPAEEG